MALADGPSNSRGKLDGWSTAHILLSGRLVGRQPVDIVSKILDCVKGIAEAARLGCTARSVRLFSQLIPHDHSADVQQGRKARPGVQENNNPPLSRQLANIHILPFFILQHQPFRQHVPFIDLLGLGRGLLGWGFGGRFGFFFFLCSVFFFLVALFVLAVRLVGFGDSVFLFSLGGTVRTGLGGGSFLGTARRLRSGLGLGSGSSLGL